MAPMCQELTPTALMSYCGLTGWYTRQDRARLSPTRDSPLTLLSTAGGADPAVSLCGPASVRLPVGRHKMRRMSGRPHVGRPMLGAADTPR
jgi:hypothetical protein